MTQRQFHGYPLPDAAGNAHGYVRATNADLAHMTEANLLAERAELRRALREWNAERVAHARKAAPLVVIGLRAVPANMWARERIRLIDRSLTHGRDS